MELESCLVAPGDWQRASIDSVCAKFTSGGTPSRKKPEYFENGTIPWVKTKELLDCVLGDAEESITDAAIAASSAKRLPRNTVLMAMYGATVGQLGLLGREMACNQACAAMVVNGARCDYRFLYYQLLANRRQIVSMATGAAQQNLSGTQIKTWIFPLPDREEQRRIADLLWSLDERIALLRQTNATLEAIAQALFKSWFVDFDPVRAKAEGREPEGMDATTAALFPSEFEDSKLGRIPKGWSRIAFGDAADLSKGSTNPLASPEQEFRHYSLPAFDAGRLPTVEFGAAIKSNKTPVPSDAVLVSKLNPHIPRIWFVGDVGERAVCSTEFLVWMPKAGVGSAFLYCLAASSGFNSAMRQLVTGTSNSHQRVKPGQLAGVQAAVVSDNTVAGFEELAAPLLARVVHNRHQAASLAELRDTLLPRLISGKLRLPEAEVAIEEAMA